MNGCYGNRKLKCRRKKNKLIGFTETTSIPTIPKWCPLKKHIKKQKVIEKPIQKTTRKPLQNEELFLENLVTIINNLLINNINYKNRYYLNKNICDLIDDTKERAQFILDKIKQTKHLILD
jgi:hypothetical protein